MAIQQLKASKLNNNPGFQNLICFMVGLCGIGVLNVWAFAHTIAARNILLALGSFSGLILMSSAKGKLLQTRFFCAYLLLGVVAWMLFHFLALSVAPEIASKELKSTWLRVFLAVTLSASLGLIASRSKLMRDATLLSFFFLPALQLGLYAAISLQAGHLPDTAFNGVFISKAGGTYFLMWPFLVTCAYIEFKVRQLVNPDKQGHFLLEMTLATCVLVCCFATFYTLRSLNGLLIASICGSILMIRISIFSFVNKCLVKTTSAFIALLICSATFIFHSYIKNDGGKLNHLFTDLAIGTQVDTYTNWRNYANTPWLPTVLDGHIVNQSTYYRIANAIEGVRIIKEHPLGAGFTYLPYGYYLSKLYPGSASDHTHSGWIDFTLGVGIPGLVLCLGAMALAISIGLNYLRKCSSVHLPETIWPYITIWCLGGITLLWLVLEVSEKEYIEHLFFMIALLGAGNTPLPNNNALK